MDDIPHYIDPESPRLMDRFRIFIRTLHLANATEKTYTHWLKRYIYRCQPWRAKRRLVIPGSREAALLIRRARSAPEEAK
ncbi:MAG: hypothetical protein RNU03_09360 [Candidatus Sedimenticola sp. (ex Thyasira tokunagai)]